MYSVEHKNPQPFYFDMSLGKSINWFSALCVLWAACYSIHPCMGAASCSCSQLMPSASQPEDHTNQGTMLMVTCRPRAPLFGILTVPILPSQLRDTGFSDAVLLTRENKWWRHQDMKDGAIFEVSPGPHFKD